MKKLKYIMLIFLAIILLMALTLPVFSAPRKGDVGILSYDETGQAWVKVLYDINHGLKTAAISTSFSEHQTNKGEHYIAGDTVTLNSGNNKLYLMNSTSTTDETHIIFLFKTTGEAFWDLWEFPTVTGEGTALPLTNKNRNFTDTTTLEIFGAPTISAIGNRIRPEGHIGAGVTVGGQNTAIGEWVLKPNTYYIFNSESQAATNEISVEFHPYLSDDAF